ncbi:MAG: lysophospholipid acyltransferase family protein [Dehalococcoidia bacterium]
MRLIVAVATRARIDGRERVPPDGPLMLVSNHLSWADPPMLVATTPRVVNFMAKSELWEQPVLAFFGRHHGELRIRRGEADRQAIRDADALFKRGGFLGIMPEGTRSKTGGLLHGQPGAAYLAYRNNVPIVPVGVTGTEAIHKPADLLRRPRVRIVFGEPFRLDPANRKNLAAATDQIMLAIAALLPERYRGVYRDGPPPHPTRAAANLAEPE